MKINVLITGASSGIGAACVESWVKAGATVMAVARNEQKLALFAKRFPGRRVIPFPCDVGSGSSVAAMHRYAAKHFDKLDVLINNAGTARFEPVSETTLAHWNITIDSILTGTFLVTKTFLPLLQASRKAHIFNICSTASKKGFVNCGAYAAAKFGQLGFTEVLREEMRPLGIKVTAVMPGAVDTPFWDVQNSGFDRSLMLKAEDVAKAIVFTYRRPKNNLIEEILIKPSCGDL